MTRAIALVLSIIFAACGSAPDDDPIPVIEFEPEAPGPTVTTVTLADRDCPEGSVLTYENFGAPFMRNWCTGCHSSQLGPDDRAAATPGVDLETPELVRRWAPRIWARSADANLTMPPGGGPTDDERARLGEWLACGAP